MDELLADITYQNMVLKMEEQVKMTTPSKYAGLRAAIPAQLMTGFWFGVGVMLAVGVVDGLNHFVRAVTRGE